MKNILPMSEADRKLFSSAGFLIVVLGVAIPLLWVYLSQFSLPGYTYPVSPQGKGMDLNPTIAAAAAIRDGRNPYAETSVLTRTPITLILHVPFTYLPDFNKVFALYQVLTLVATFASLALLAHWAGFGFWGVFAATAVTLFTNPFQLHYDRGQTDAFSAAAAIFACYLARRERLGWAFLLGLLAVQLKLNALALVLPFLIGTSLQTSLKRSGAFLGLLAASFLLTPELSSDYLSKLGGRSQWLIPGNNGSIYRFFSMLPLGSVLAPLFLVVVGGLLVLGIAKLRTAESSDPVLTGLFWMLPFSTAYPPTNFLYCYVLLPALVFAWCSDEESLPVRVKRLRWLACVGLSLALFPVGFLYARYGEMRWFGIPPTGLFLMLVASAVIALGEGQRSPGTTVDQGSVR
jgi:hypothetical protein